MADVNDALTRRERRQLVRLLGQYQDLLESAIDASTVQDTGEATEPDEEQVKRDRRDWKLAEKWVVRLTKGG